MGYRDNIKREFDSKVVEVARVTRVVAGGKRMRFRALVVVGDRKGRVGIGLKKGVDVADAIGKATNAAQRSVIEIQIKEGTIPHLLNYKYKAARIFIKPAKPGTGIIAGGPLRAVLTLSGIRNITSKMLGSSNKVSNVRAIFLALQSFNRGKK
ncbi:MAG: 30S ribosomal protein S5 [Parcubacteria group bacterium GW2011_GWA2_51_12]|nr:MAG: 30S ribosomal protein S5 [Parcubacteria group bacterium GW2011_GWA2_51_12]